MQDYHQNQPIPLPFVITKAFAHVHLMGRFYDDLHELFAFNECLCGRECPDLDETVLPLADIM
jgi:hypothetical protein